MIFLSCVVSFFRGFVLETFGLHFSWILGGWPDHVSCVFLFVSGAPITKKTVVLIQYLLCFMHIALVGKKEKVKRRNSFLRTYLERASELDLPTSLGLFYRI